MESQRKLLSVDSIRFLVTSLLLLETLSTTNRHVAADGNIGCLFSPTLCIQDVELCFDDYAFGHCIQQYGNLEDEDVYRYDLTKEELNILERDMQRLFSLGYRWSHMYTQCTLQAILYAFKTRTEYDPNICDHLKDQDLNAALKAIESDVEMEIEPQNMAIVKFTPSLGDPHPDFADEVYFPPLTPEEINEALAIPPPRDTVEFEPRFLQKDDQQSLLSGQGYKEFPYSLLRKKSVPDFNPVANEEESFVSRSYPTHFSTLYNTPDQFRSGYESRDLGNDQQMVPFFINNDDNEMLVPSKLFETPANTYPSRNDYYGSPENEINTAEFEKELYNNAGVPTLISNQQRFSQDPSREMISSPSVAGFNRQYNTPDAFRQGFETKDNNYRNGVDVSSDNKNKGLLYHLGYKMSLPPNQQVDLLQNSGDNMNINNEILSEMSSAPPRGYTEGGMVFLPSKNNKNSAEEEEEEEEALSELLSGLDPALGWGFKRRERLDVKKPGPFFSTNNYAFQDNKEKHEGENVVNIKHNSSKKSDDSDLAGSKEMLPEELFDNRPESLMNVPEKKELAPTHPPLDPEQYDVVDLDYVYIRFQERIREWKDGNKIVATVAKLLKVPESTFTHVRVDRNEVTFKVNPKGNIEGYNSSAIVKKIEEIKDRLKKDAHVTVTSAGIGNKTKLPPQVLPLSLENDQEFYILSFILIGVIAAVVVSAAALYIIRRHATSRAKLQNITAPDTEASKDYQDLCRARMTGTKPTQEVTPAGQRIASLSRESDNSPSSRSSTSSWSEEPALTNMDISTGHMVLSYMEDHLRNKDRLEREWAALCAYEAEPCATTIAQRPENTKKNRYVNALPYDHARVMLNELSNISGSDYINASTIADHDPRNPVYIATQGPLPHTTPDLWQMVWEQGCVVMVMLTRLIENEQAMCHRYWPEEGSELYHIYEVHLVSEHIWCDDYLVRSFYLKNLKTGETRTVTQFHFLSWPDGGVPTSIKPLLEFRRKVNKSFRGRSCPIVVHCSDGVGRTGTYCLLDMVLNRMAKGAKEIDIAATLEHIRDQRMGSVATKQQFQLVLAAVAEEVQAILRVLPQQQQVAQQQPPQQQSQQEEKKQ